MQEHIKGPYSEILQKHKNNTTQEEKPKKIKKTEQHRHLANKCEDIVNSQGRRHIVSPRAQPVFHASNL